VHQNTMQRGSSFGHCASIPATLQISQSLYPNLKVNESIIEVTFDKGAVNCFVRWATKLAWSWVSAQLIDEVPCSRIPCLNTVCRSHDIWTRSWGHSLYKTCLLHYSWLQCFTTGG